MHALLGLIAFAGVIAIVGETPAGADGGTALVNRPEEVASIAHAAQLFAKVSNAGVVTPTTLYESLRLAMLQDPSAILSLSDAGAHCGSICDGGMPTFMLTHWARDRTRGEKMPLEFVVKRQTSETAAMFGFHDRGVVAPGKRADLNLINYDELKVMTPFMAYDLPAGGRRLMQNAKGYDATFVAGVQIVDHDQFTGALPGKLVRRGR